MHSFSVYACVVLAAGASAVVLPPAITSAPSLVVKRDEPDAISLAQVLLTAVPEWIREVAATNVPAASSIIWSEFLDGNLPWWFTDLPEDIQVYLIEEFGPKTAALSAISTIPAIFPSLTESDVPGATDGPLQSSSPAATSQASGSRPFKSSQSAQTSGSESASASKTSSTGSTQTPETTTSPSYTSEASSSQYTHSSTRSLVSRITLSTQVAAPSASTSGPPSAPSSDSSGLSRSQKLGIGLSVPLAIMGAAAFLFGCCFLLRRRRRKSVDGSVPPSSPGFIPRFSFQEKTTNDIEHRPLNRGSENSLPDWGNSAWNDDGIDLVNDQPVTSYHPQPQQWPQQQPAIVPALVHTHSSNRARGKRTSYTSLHSVAEVSEPDEMESPVLPRDSPPHISPARQSPKRPSLIIPPIPAAAQIKRKPIGSPPSQSPAAEAASQTLLRQTMGHHNPYRYRNHTSKSTITTSPISPSEEHTPGKPFVTALHGPHPNHIHNNNNYHRNSNHGNDDSYVEDYGPEYHSGYVDDVENAMFGGHTSLSRYPEPKSSSPKSGRSEWPLRNTRSHRRNKSPLWDRVYDG